MKLVRLAGLVVLAPMVRTQVLYLSATLLVLIALVAAPNRIPAQQAPQVAIDNDDIGGVVRSPSGPKPGCG